MEKIHNQHAITYRALTQSDMSAASVLHEQVLESTGSRIGQSYLRALYRELLTNSNESVVLGAFHREALVGLVSASRSVDATESVISTHIFSLLPHIIKSGIMGHISFHEIITQRSLHAYVKKQMKPSDVYIHALLVDPLYRRHGIASTLVGEVQKSMRPGSIYVDTRNTNTAAIQSYAQMGFERIKELGNAILLRSVQAS